ncbi:hypothetical protein ACNFIA_24425 [Pseudomonas sp. NY15437]|uniref:hypothetical protein n=1 Tax=Pseudomonas sp. NY15437 TaxID=3400360 RepID=UPI003A85A1BE
MNAKQTIEEVRNQLALLKRQGTHQVNVDGLDAYLKDLSAAIENSMSIDQINIDFQKQENDFNNQSAQRLFDSVIGNGQAALKTSILVGGGSAAALLAFASSAWRSLKPEGLEALSLSVFLLAIGVLCSAIASGMSYVAQYFFHSSFYDEHKAKERIGHGANIASNALVVVAYILYGVASWNVYKMLGWLEIVKPFTA